MKNKRRLLTSLLVSGQILSAVSLTPVMAEEIGMGMQATVSDDLPAGAYTDDYLERYYSYLSDSVYSAPVKERLDAMLLRSKSLKTEQAVLDLIVDFTDIHTAMDTSDAAHYHADGDLMNRSTAKAIHQAIKTALFKGEYTNTLKTYANRLGLSVHHGVRAHQDLIQDLYNTNQLDAAFPELERVVKLVTTYTNAKNAGNSITLKLDKNHLFSPELDAIPVEETVPVDSELPEPEQAELDLDIAYDSSDAPAKDLSGALSSTGDRTGSYYEYDKENGRRIRIDYTIRVVDGKEDRSETRTVEASDLTSMWSDRYGSFFDTVGVGGSSTSTPAPEKKKEARKLSLQYTLNKGDKFPVYVDTGVFADENGIVSYKALYDVLYQMAANAEDGFLVEDAKKLLVVMEGRPVFIKESDKTFTQDMVADLFQSFENLDLMVSETRIGTTNSLEWQLKTGQAQRVVIDSTDVTLKTEPVIRGKRVVLPVEELMTEIGATVEKSEKALTARYKDTVIVFEAGVSEAKVNDTRVSLDVPVEANKKTIWTANLMPIFKAIGVEARWDEEDSTLYLDNTERVAQKEKEAAKKAADKKEAEKKKPETETKKNR